MTCPPIDDTSVNGVVRYVGDDEEEEGPLWDCDRAYEFGDFGDGGEDDDDSLN